MVPTRGQVDRPPSATSIQPEGGAGRGRNGPVPSRIEGAISGALATLEKETVPLSPGRSSSQPSRVDREGHRNSHIVHPMGYLRLRNRGQASGGGIRRNLTVANPRILDATRPGS